MFQRFKKLQWLVIMPAIAFICQGCDRCRSDELPVIQIVMQFQEQGRYILRGDLVEDRLIISTDLLQLPIALNADTTVYEFYKLNGQMWRLALAYDRRTDFESRGCGFFMQFQNVRVLSESTFSNVRLVVNPWEWNVTVTE